jgi:23S rRNA (cytidine2498-2'-O)-methyltransferase
MSKDIAHFVFMTCRAGAEGAIKQEVARIEPAWRLAFSRPGFLTFKRTSERPSDDRQLAERHWTFAHAHGISLGRVSGDSVAELANQVWRTDGVATLVGTGQLADIHVWQREQPEVRDTIEDLVCESFMSPLAEEIEVALQSAAPAECKQRLKQQAERCLPSPRNGLVLDIVVVEPGEWWIGYHRAITHAQRWPGGAIPATMPGHAVSRAYAKLEEAIAWSGIPLSEGDECVEIGCAPGGASQALLDRGLFVTGVDPAEVDSTVLKHPRFRHIRKRGKEVQRKEFVGVRWLVADMNIAPEATLETIESIVANLGLAIRGLVLTLKFSDWADSRKLPEFITRIRGWGYRDVRARHLVCGGQEVCVVALRRKALRRLGRTAPAKRMIARHPQGKLRSKARRRRDEGHESPAGPHF